MDKKALIKKLIFRFGLLLLFIMLFIFIPAGDFFYWQAYVYFAILLGPMFLILIYFLKKDPEFLEKRMHLKEKEKTQKLVVLFTTIVYFLGFIIIGLDYRFFWSDVPIYLVILADLIVFLSYISVFFVFKANSFASRVVEVEENQKVISSGPYSIVRHPMYIAQIIMFLATPLALGSYWGIIPFLALPFSMAVRVLNEEKVLSKELPGYKEYCQKVKYRLIPFVW